MFAKDLTGEKFGKWQVLWRDGAMTDSKGHAFWIVRCECGTVASVRGDQLRFGRTNSCSFCGNRGSGSKRHIIQRGE